MATDGQRPGVSTANASLVVVATHSRIIGVVIERIVERVGMRAVVMPPPEAEVRLALLHPGVVVLDGGPEDDDCTDLYPSLRAMRQTSDVGLPFVVLLTARNFSPATATTTGLLDASVAKPITPDRLQPIIAGLYDRARAV